MTMTGTSNGSSKSGCNELREAFALFDADGDGEVTVKELSDIFKKLRAENKIKQSELQALLRASDKDKNGTINFQEFHELWEKLKSYGSGSECGLVELTQEEKTIREEFDKLDQDGSGFICKSEMMKTISGCNFLAGDREAEAKKCIDDIDVNGDGKISYPEFLMVWKFKY